MQVVCIYWCALSTPTMTLTDAPLPQSLLASPACPLPADLREPELAIPSFVSTCHPAVDSPPLFPGPTMMDDKLATTKALLTPSPAAVYAVVASTPYFPSPIPHLVPDVGQCARGPDLHALHAHTRSCSFDRS